MLQSLHNEEYSNYFFLFLEHYGGMVDVGAG